MKDSLVWQGIWDLAIIASTIAVLNGCRTNYKTRRTKAEANLGLVRWSRETIGLIWGEECANATADYIPDLYNIGASGVCRTVDGKSSCKARFPPSPNLAKYVLQDFDKVNSTEDASTILDSCREAIDKPIDHKTAEKLGIAMVSFLIISIFVTVISFIVALASEEPFGILTTFVLGIDGLFIFSSLVLCIAMMNYEGGGYLKGVHGGEFSDREMIGVALWMILGMLIARALSNPWLVLLALAIILPIVLVFLLFLVRTRGSFEVVKAVAQNG